MKKYTVGALLLTSALAAPALAADLGTDAGSIITNNFTVDYSVGGVDQADITTNAGNNASFTVDRKVDLTVIENGGGDQTEYRTNEQDAVTEFLVTNKTNGYMDYALTAANNAAGDDVDMDTDFLIFVESGDNVGYQPGEDTATFIDELAEDASVVVYVLADYAGTPTADQTADITLTAVSREAATTPTDVTPQTGALGAVLAKNNADANTAGVDNVFVDVAGAGDATADQDGRASNVDTYIFKTAALSLSKESAIIWDPVTGTTNPKNIPGAIVEYCLKIENTGGDDATSVSFSDTLPTEVESNYSTADGEPANIFRLGATTCDASVTSGAAYGTAEDFDATGAGDNGSINATTVSVQNQTVAAGSTGTPTVYAVRFRVKIR
ncbi:MAG: hypothetical protein WA979_11485 [Pacificimonas sp.]